MVLIIVFILAAMVRGFDENELYYKSIKIKKNILVAYIFMTLSLLSGLRYGVGTDYFGYRKIFLKINENNIESNRDWGYYLLNKLVINFSKNPQAIFLVTSFIINFFIIYTIYKYSKLFEVSIFLYISTYMYFSSFNGIRQWIAASILFFGTKYLLERKFLKYFIIVFIASTFHQTALIMLPVYFLVNHKFKSLKTIILILIGGVIFILYKPFTDLLMQLLEGTKFFNDYNETIGVSGNGANFLRVVVASIPVILSYIMYNSVNKSTDNKIDILINLSLINCLFMLLGTRHWIFARFLMYFEPYNLILYPLILIKFDKKNIKLIYYLLIVFYLLFCILILKSGDSNIVPYRINLDLFR
ncbi:EpsG family protein [Clostridium perfringens]|uniref:EpsG family protein n=1 Tax=Clostridium perfringens TaxID=1502 RepID=UPI002ACC2E9E|nr:EpsG family protein [Clostridium perfringens]